jgi:hypothetical protein
MSGWLRDNEIRVHGLPATKERFGRPRGFGPKILKGGERLWVFMAAPQGFEPRYADPESAVLPLNEGAVDLILWALWLAVNRAAVSSTRLTRGR